MATTRITPQISFIGLPSSEAIEERILQGVGRLERLFDRITSCRVVVEVPHRQHQRGNKYRVRIELAVPGNRIVVNREDDRPEYEDAYVVLRDAFNAAGRQLEDYVERLRGE